ncbi:MAG: Ig-like domain-containing protein [Clostridiales bacterium]|nr:Ig-like domain-containing protein [Clostridiales bacterium]
MKMKKMKKLISLAAGLAIGISSFSGLTASAGVVGTVRNYTFEQELTASEEITGWNGTHNFYADGYDNLFCLSDGWIPKVGDVVQEFTRTAEAAKSGSYGLQIRVSKGRIYFNIPKTETESVMKTYKITVPMKLIDIASGDGWVYAYAEAGDLTTNAAVNAAKGGQIFKCSTSNWSTYTYTGTFDASVNSCVTVKPVGDYTFAFDDITIEEMGAAVVTKVVPADSSVNVPQYEKPTVTFDAPIDAATISGITLTTGTKTVAAANTLSADGLTVTIAPESKLAENTEYTINVPGTVKDTVGVPVETGTFKFTTGSKNMVLEYDFDNATADDLKLIYGTNGWGASYSLGSLSSSNALQLSLPAQYNWAMISFPKAIYANASRKFIVSFDMMGAAASRTWTDIYWGKTNSDKDQTNLARYDSNQRKVHYEFLVDSASLWNGAGIRFANPVGVNSNIVLIDNIKVEYLDELRVVSASPANEQVDIMTNAPVTVTFNKELLNADSIAILDVTDEENPKEVDCTITQDADSVGRPTVTLAHNGLNPSTRYAVDLSGITDADGKSLADAEQVIYFTTASFAATGNELFIYGFESEVDGDKGISNGVHSAWAVNYDRTTEAASSGLYSLRVDTDASVAEDYGNIHFNIPDMDQMQYSQNFYSMTIDMKDNYDEGNSKVSFILAYYVDGKSDCQYTWLAEDYEIADEFTTLEKTFVIHESKNIYEPRIYMLVRGQGSFYIDNFRVEKTDKPIMTLYGDGTEIRDGKLVAASNASVKYENIPENAEYIGVIAVYKDDVLQSLELAAPTSAGGEDNEALISLPADKEGCKVKAFLLNSLKDLTPIIEAKQAQPSVS